MEPCNDRAQGIIKLENPVKYYDWGSPEWIPALLNLDNRDKNPYAELWMGGVSEAGGKPLASLIRNAPDFFLGADIAKRYQGALPYLFKLLAAEKPLSIQAHPNLTQARAGFLREEARHIPLYDPKRSYKDANHKPEIICALSDYEALCGFRPPAEIAHILRCFACPTLDFLEKALNETKSDEELLRAFTEQLFELPADCKEKLARYSIENIERLSFAHPQYEALWRLCVRLQKYYPGDCAVIAPFYMNYIWLAPGEAIYLPAGILHCYLHGFGVELMANSDNVIRGGLTSKFIDTAELFAVLDFHAFNPALLKPDAAECYTYTASAMADDFKLSVMHGSGTAAKLSLAGPVIIVVVQGTCTINGKDTVVLRAGESAFIAAGAVRDQFTLNGTWTAYLASCIPAS